jgi:hypothetical protein
MVCYVNQIKTVEQTFRALELANDFYLGAFVVWLVFNIKLSFSLPVEDYIRFCRNYFHGHWKDK